MANAHPDNPYFTVRNIQLTRDFTHAEDLLKSCPADYHITHQAEYHQATLSKWTPAVIKLKKPNGEKALAACVKYEPTGPFNSFVGRLTCSVLGANDQQLLQSERSAFPETFKLCEFCPGKDIVDVSTLLRCQTFMCPNNNLRIRYDIEYICLKPADERLHGAPAHGNNSQMHSAM